HADDSADTRVKVGNRQAPLKNPLLQRVARGFCFALPHRLLAASSRFLHPRFSRPGNVLSGSQLNFEERLIFFSEISH
ncbi:hypothetical protein, partial [Pandoraea communis]|uniref:hypothetical protein n=1 Tax=Pandoraea communis TaxID=2508297 RepID=UPI001C2DDB9C